MGFHLLEALLYCMEKKEGCDRNHERKYEKIFWKRFTRQSKNDMINKQEGYLWNLCLLEPITR